MNHKPIPPSSLLSIMKVLGLEMTDKNGGQYFDNLVFKDLLTANGYTQLRVDRGDDLLILGPELFLQTLERTESSLNIKLFS